MQGVFLDYVHRCTKRNASCLIDGQDTLETPIDSASPADDHKIKGGAVAMCGLIDKPFTF
jgi:hypothetical protein